MRALSLFLAALALGVGPLQAQFRQQAQDPAGLGLRGDLTFVQLSGSVGDSVGTGLGLSADAFYEFPQYPVRTGIGGSYTRFSTEGDLGTHSKFSVHAFGSWHIADPNTAVVPYIQGNIGYAWLSDDGVTCEAYPLESPDDAGGCTAALNGREWSGPELGAAVGVDLPLGEALNIDVAGTFSWIALGDLTAGGRGVPNTSTNSSAFGLRGGFTYFPR